MAESSNRQTRRRRPQQSESRKHTPAAVNRPLQDITDRFKSTTPRRNPHSPLPPSSPPSPSSIDLFSHHAQHISSSRLEHDIGSNVNDAHLGSDPFGFFIVEKKLKTLRAQQPRYRAAPPPYIKTNNLVTPPTPPTPSKRRNKRKAPASPTISSRSDFQTDSVPSTPSPSKPISRKGKEKEIFSSKGGSNIEDDTGNESFETTGEAEKVIPRRSRRAAKITCKDNAGNQDQQSSKGPGRVRRDNKKLEPVRMTTKGSTRQTQKSSRRKVGRTADDEQTKKWEQERLARLDYFKKLEDYQVEKENIYIV